MISETADYALQAQDSVPPSGMREPCPAGNQILRRSQVSASGRKSLGCRQRIQQQMVQGQQTVPVCSSSLRRMSEVRQVCQGDGGGSYRSPPGRQGSLLGSEQLAGALSPASQHQDKTRRPQPGVQVLKTRGVSRLRNSSIFSYYLSNRSLWVPVRTNNRINSFSITR